MTSLAIGSAGLAGLSGIDDEVYTSKEQRPFAVGKTRLGYGRIGDKMYNLDDEDERRQYFEDNRKRQNDEDDVGIMAAAGGEVEGPGTGNREGGGAYAADRISAGAGQPRPYPEFYPDARPEPDAGLRGPVGAHLCQERRHARTQVGARESEGGPEQCAVAVCRPVCPVADCHGHAHRGGARERTKTLKSALGPRGAVLAPAHACNPREAR